MNSRLEVRFPDVAAGKSSEVHVALKVHVDVDPTVPGRPDLVDQEDKLARLLLHVPSHGHPHVIGENHRLGDVAVKYQRVHWQGGRIERWYEPLYGEPVHISFPPLWPGDYEVRCHLIRRQQGRESSLGPPAQGLVRVLSGKVGRKAAHRLPLYLSNLFHAVPRPDVDSVNMGSGEIPFSLQPTGYPVMDTVRAVGISRPQDALPAVQNLLARMRAYVDFVPADKQIYSPVFRRDTDVDKSGGSRRLLLAAMVPEVARINSDRLASSGAGVAKAAERSTGMLEDDRLYEYLQARHFFIEAVQDDPNNARAILGVARMSFLRRDWAQAYDFFLTLVGRLWLAKRILCEEASRRFLSGLVKDTVSAYLSKAFFAELDRCAADLGLSDITYLELPDLRSIVV